MSRQRDLFANFERMRREMDELFGDIWSRPGYPARAESGFSPAIDVYYCGDPPRAIVKVDLPGVDLKDIQLEISGRQLVISGERPVQATEGRVYQQLEIDTGPFRRVVGLSADVSAEHATATYEEGILRVALPLLTTAEETRQVPIERGDD